MSKVDEVLMFGMMNESVKKQVKPLVAEEVKELC
jgi:hypothetical protein